MISKDILSTEELNEANEILRGENVIVENVDQILEYIDLAVVHKQTKIIFITLIPLLKPDIFEHQRLEPITKHGKLLDLTFKEALNNNRFTYFIVGECTAFGTIIVCSEQHLKDVTKDTCFSKILRGVSGNCDFVEASEESLVKRISSNHVVIMGNENVPIESNCGLSNRNISGDTLIYFRNCTLIVNHTSYKDIEYVSKQQPMLIPLDGLKIIGKAVSTNFTLHKLKEINLETRQRLQSIQQQQTHSTLGTSLAIVAAFIILTFYIFRDRFMCTSKQPNQNVPGRSVLQGGAVTERTQQPVKQHSSVSTPTDGNVNIPDGVQRKATPETIMQVTTDARATDTTRSADIARYPTPMIGPRHNGMREPPTLHVPLTSRVTQHL